ncbi:ATP-binding protein [Streptomyces europaeiscabiei]|uniref:ATP-binding protein n=1 Tax=Streptomyces europaeiscabiei TaxID=146819 RepID=UPI0029AAC0DB|nr:ATP-binding protein [Streptomyces europaeiscabiei]MDX3847021.1 ATP-binding protein [Streptomyces europaeiscabiei]
MSDSPPATRSERRRHGKSWARRVNTSAGLRSRLGQLAVLPPCVVLLLIALPEYLLRTEPPWSGTRLLVWTVAAASCTGVLVVAWRMSRATADAVHRHRVADVEAVQQQQAAERQAVSQWITRLRSVMADGLKAVQTTVDQLQRGEQPQVRELPPEPEAPHPFTALEYELLEFVHGVQTALTDSSARQEKAAVLSIARRILTLINSTLKAFDALEREMEDPEVLSPLFRLDHMVTRLRRLAESLTVAGGALPRRSGRATLLSDVISHAISEIEQYERVRLVSPVDGTVDGRAATGLVHLLAELLDNAANFSDPQTQVLVRVEMAASGVIIQIDDRGKPMPQATLAQLNGLLSEPSRHRSGDYLRDGRIGMWVVAEYARHLGLHVRLQRNFYGSNQAEVRVPHGLFTAAPERQEPAARPGRPSPSPAHALAPKTSTAAARTADRTGGAPAAAPPAMTHSVEPNTGSEASGIPPLPTHSGSEVPDGSGDGDQLPKRDLSRSYLAPGLQNSTREARGSTAPSAPPSAGLMSRVAEGRLRAERGRVLNPSPLPEPTAPPHSLEVPRGDHDA